MKRSHLLWYLIITSMLLFLIPHKAASAKQAFDRITISGPGLKGEIDITDQRVADLGLNAGTIEEFDQVPIPRPKVGEGYTLTRYFKDEVGIFFVWDQIRYYPGETTSRGYVLYSYTTASPVSKYEGEWFDATPRFNVAIRKLLAQLGVPLTISTTLPRTGGSALPFKELILSGILILLFGCFLLRRSELSS